jgi:hypothetical protein
MTDHRPSTGMRAERSEYDADDFEWFGRLVQVDACQLHASARHQPKPDVHTDREATNSYGEYTQARNFEARTRGPWRSYLCESRESART